jgi:hypothetical protein
MAGLVPANHASPGQWRIRHWLGQWQRCENNAFDTCAWLEHVDGRDKAGHDTSETQVFLSRLTQKDDPFHVSRETDGRA